ncbi:fumarylacetoacetate hydrolase family protein [Halalkalibacillus halophilus]|uniref:fumarylacetoacetate hydrolase family protein n=1 Tax=Halalkalibacillus halophilus TaxID=392827 RepID=UPI0004139791|nr:fumarylacetoacetate hydrolase family protein [Halalkalibacillus halophilus]
MRLVAFNFMKQNYWGIERDGGIYYSAKLVSVFPTLLSVIENAPILDLESEIHQFIPLEDIEIEPPYIPKKNIICVGKNYPEHAAEMADGNDKSAPVDPMIFTKSSGAVIGANQTIDAHATQTSELDYEGELAVIIGQDGKNIDREDALDHVFGYSIINDISARDLQIKHQQYFRAKSLDTFAPFGPAIVTKDEVPNPQDLKIVTHVNGEKRQDGRTKDMMFSVAELIEVISDGMTLHAGDVIITGSPSGVGKGFNPPKYLKAGDVIGVEIAPIGTLVNKVE